MASKILIVEDEPALQDTLEYNLTHQGYEVQVVGDGFKAIQTAHDFQPHLVLLDVMLPG
ncbi:MAG: response regulator, partial [bacterium]